jgi:sugar phosphate permease
MIYAIPITSVAIAGVVGFVLGRARRGPALIFCTGTLVLIFAFTVWAPPPAAYVDAVALAAVGVLVAMPGITGVLGGAVLGWLSQRHAKSA